MGIFDRLTDSSLYTGAHKHRFDGDGNGRGLAGRDSISKGSGHVRGGAGGVADLSQICRTNLDHGGGTSILGSSRDTGGGTFYNSGMAPLRGVTPVSSAKPSLINDAAGSWRTPVPQRAGSASRPVRASADGGAAAARPPSAHLQSVPGISPSSPSERASYETNYMHSPGSSGRTTTTPVPSPSFINENAGSWRTPVPQRPLSAARPVRASADGAAGGTASSRQPVVQHVQPSFAPSTERLNFEKNYKSAEAARGGGGGNGGGNSIISPKQSLISNVAGSLINQNAGSWRGQVPSRPISASRPIRASADGGGFGTANTASFSQPVQRPTSAMRGVRASADGGSGAARSGGSIFDKLTDSSQYTGAHKQRFDGAGNGRGASGRTTGASNVNAADNCRRG